MFALIGLIPFEVVGSPEGYTSKGKYEFAEQKVVEAKPQIQWTGDDLQRLTFDIRWHASFTNPGVQLAALRASAATHLASPLVFGDGTIVGLFVIESIDMKSQVMTATGGLVEITVALALKEAPASSLVGGLTGPLLGIL
jgi:phage protein U